MPTCDLLQSIMVLICIALHGNRPIPHSHYPGEIQLRLAAGKISPCLSKILPPAAQPSFYIQALIRVMRDEIA